MYFLSSFLVAASTLAFAPSAGINYIPDPEPIPLPIVRTAEEVKPIPNPAATEKEVECNCWNLLKKRFGSTPSMEEMQAQASEAFGNVGVFMYPPSPGFPNGTPHVSLTTGKMGYGTFEIEEYNYHRCKYSKRYVSFTDKRFVGFINL